MLRNSVDTSDLTELLKASTKPAIGLSLTYIGDGRFKLNEQLKTQFGDVPEGFVTDGFTLPWFVRWFHNPFGKGLYAAIWHDFALKSGRKNPHKEFFTLLVERKVPKWKAYPMWFFVWAYSRYYKACQAFKKLVKKLQS